MLYIVWNASKYMVVHQIWWHQSTYGQCPSQQKKWYNKFTIFRVCVFFFNFVFNNDQSYRPVTANNLKKCMIRVVITLCIILKNNVKGGADVRNGQFRRLFYSTCFHLYIHFWAINKNHQRVLIGSGCKHITAVRWGIFFFQNPDTHPETPPN